MFDVHISTAYRLKEKFKQDNTVKRRVGLGRPRKTSFEDGAPMVEAHENDRFRIPEETCLDFNVSGRTVSRRLKESGLRARKAATKPHLKPEHREARMNWAVKYRRWTLADWSNVLFTDEASFSVSQRDGRVHCYRRTNERYLDNTVRETMNRDMVV